jgi:type IV pilus assembly protein PilC
MPVFIWKGEDRKGTTQKGEIEAPHERAVRAQLGRMQIKPTKIKQKPKDLFENVSFMQPKVQTAEVVVFARQFATMIDAGLPLIQSLDILYSQQENKTFKKTLKEIKDSVEQGSTLADALGKYPNIFDDLFVNMVAAGEVGGILDTILDRLSGYMEKAMKLKKQVKGAMTYPIIVLVIAALVVGVILVFVIPVFQKMFADFGGALPAPTQIVVGISNFVKGNIHYIIGAVVVFVFAFKRF